MLFLPAIFGKGPDKMPMGVEKVLPACIVSRVFNDERREELFYCCPPACFLIGVKRLERSKVSEELISRSGGTRHGLPSKDAKGGAGERPKNPFGADATVWG